MNAYDRYSSMIYENANSDDLFGGFNDMFGGKKKRFKTGKFSKAASGFKDATRSLSLARCYAPPFGPIVLFIIFLLLFCLIAAIFNIAGMSFSLMPCILFCVLCLLLIGAVSATCYYGGYTIGLVVTLLLMSSMCSASL